VYCLVSSSGCKWEHSCFESKNDYETSQEPIQVLPDITSSLQLHLLVDNLRIDNLPVHILPNLAIHNDLNTLLPQTRHKTARPTMMVLQQPNRLQLPKIVTPREPNRLQ
jgi:hypothetical protein